jgi:CheY-like chemotaxis protein
VVEDNDIERQSIVELLSSDDIEIITASSGAEALDTLLDRPFDCFVLDLRLPDMSGFDLWTASRRTRRCATSRSWSSPART